MWSQTHILVLAVCALGSAWPNFAQANTALPITCEIVTAGSDERGYADPEQKVGIALGDETNSILSRLIQDGDTVLAITIRKKPLDLLNALAAKATGKSVFFYRFQATGKIRGEPVFIEFDFDQASIQEIPGQPRIPLAQWALFLQYWKEKSADQEGVAEGFPNFHDARFVFPLTDLIIEAQHYPKVEFVLEQALRDPNLTRWDLWGLNLLLQHRQLPNYSNQDFKDKVEFLYVVWLRELNRVKPHIQRLSSPEMIKATAQIIPHMIRYGYNHHVMSLANLFPEFRAVVLKNLSSSLPTELKGDPTYDQTQKFKEEFRQSLRDLGRFSDEEVRVITQGFENGKISGAQVLMLGRAMSETEEGKNLFKRILDEITTVNINKYSQRLWVHARVLQSSMFGMSMSENTLGVVGKYIDEGLIDQGIVIGFKLLKLVASGQLVIKTKASLRILANIFRSGRSGEIMGQAFGRLEDKEAFIQTLIDLKVENFDDFPKNLQAALRKKVYIPENDPHAQSYWVDEINRQTKKPEPPKRRE